MEYAIMKINKLHKTGGDKAVRSVYDHNLRVVSPLNADPEREHLNREIVSLNGKTYREAIDEAIDHQRARGTIKNVRKNAVHAYEVLMTYSREMREQFDLEEWIQANQRWLDETFNPEGHLVRYQENGEEKTEEIDNVKHLMLHMDEEVPHLHAIVVPIDPNGKLNASHYTGDRASMIKIQDRYASYMEAFGLKRGEIGSIARPREKAKYYSNITKAVNSELPEAEKGESAEEYRERANAVYQTTLSIHNDQLVKAEQQQIAKESIAREEVESFRRMRQEFGTPLRKIARMYGKDRLGPGELLKIQNEIKEKKDLDEAINRYPDRDYAEETRQRMQQMLQWQRERETAREEREADVR